jgi:16S rRNA (adenine1518-N6/adenine1519-N6)-dimethyltransferase
MTLGEIRRWLDRQGLQLTKSLGQNFLHDGNQLRRIVEAAELKATDRVLEIGPGLGPLTELLLAAGVEVTAVEVDARLVAALRERLGSPLKLQLIHADAMSWLREQPRNWSGTKLVANLPYSVGSPILVELALAPRPPERMVATLQLEVVRRLAAGAGDDDYGVLTLLVGLHFAVRDLFKIPRDCFFPAPDVDSACVLLGRRPEPLLPPDQTATFARLVKAAFSQRRKMMRKLLRGHWPEAAVDAAFAAATVSPTARAETVNLEQFVTLTRLLAVGPAPVK